MARGNTTEDELSAGIRSVGVLSAVARTEGARRDSPFATPAPQEKHPTAAPVRAARPVDPPGVPKVAASRESPRQKPELAPNEGSVKEDPAPFSDPVTVPMTADMRTRANILAAELQRRRTEKTNRFTPNSIFRVAIKTFLERFQLTAEDHVNSEEELLDLVHARLGASKRSKRPDDPS
jgi:hypothetical protein